jgi:quercetin dioxygenase-like cupin family protein
MTETAVLSQQAASARTPGAKRAGPGEYYFEMTQVDKIKGGPDYSSAFGPCVEGDRMMMALMRMAAGTGSEFHSHPNEQWIYVLEGTLDSTVDGQRRLATAGTLLYIPANTLHKAAATSDADVVFFTAKDGSYGLHGVRAG